MEKTCLIVKPDGVGKKVVGDIIKRLESEGLKLLSMKMIKPDDSTIRNFYSIHKDKSFFEPLINFMLSGPIVITVWEKDNAVSLVRSIIGATNSKDAAPGTLRNMYGTDNRRNLVHSSDSIENAQTEINFFFKPTEILQYDLNEWTKN